MKVDPNSATWRAVRAHAEPRLKESCARLKTPGIPEREADLLRGQILELEALLALADHGTEQPPVGKPDTYGLA